MAHWDYFHPHKMLSRRQRYSRLFILLLLSKAIRTKRVGNFKRDSLSTKSQHFSINLGPLNVVSLALKDVFDVRHLWSFQWNSQPWSLPKSTDTQRDWLFKNVSCILPSDFPLRICMLHCLHAEMEFADCHFSLRDNWPLVSRVSPH